MTISRRPNSKAMQYVASFAILLFSVLVFILLFSSRRRPEQAESIVTSPLVSTVPVRRHTGPVKLKTNGLAVPFREITVSAEVAGRVTFKSENCKAGIYVKGGTKLMEIDSEEYGLEVELAQAEFEQAKNQLVELEQEISGAEMLLAVATEDEEIQARELDRFEKLGGVVSTAEVNQARRALLAAQNSKLAQSSQLQLLMKRKSRLESGRDLAETKLKTARLNKRRAIVTAPSDGVIVSESVQKDDFVQRGEPMIVFEDTSAAEVKVNLRPDELQWILDSTSKQPVSADPETNAQSVNPYALPQLDATIEYEFEGGKATWQGQLSRYEGIGRDELTRTVPVRVLVKNRITVDSNGMSKSLVRGTFVTVKFEIEPKIPLLEVPEMAVSAGDIVWSVRDGQLKRHHLNVVGVLDGESRKQTEEIESVGDKETRSFICLESNNAPNVADQVVVSPLVAPLEGMTVRIAVDRQQVEPGIQNTEASNLTPTPVSAQN